MKHLAKAKKEEINMMVTIAAAHILIAALALHAVTHPPVWQTLIVALAAFVTPLSVSYRTGEYIRALNGEA